MPSLRSTSRSTNAFLIALGWGLAFVANSALIAEESVGDNTLRVMSFNIRYDNPADGSNAWSHRKDWVAELIRDGRIDVVGMQEVLKSQIEDLTVRLADYGWYGVGRDDGAQSGEYVPIFFRKARFQMTDKGSFWLCEQPAQPGRKDWGAACTRVTTWVQLLDRISGQTMFFYNTHWDHQSAAARENSARLIRLKMAERADSPLVLTGDFNCTLSSQPLRALLEETASPDDVELTDTHQLAGPNHVGPLSTWNGFREIVPGRCIDFVFAGPGWQITRHEILDVRRDGRFPSDHLPVIAHLRWRGE